MGKVAIRTYTREGCVVFLKTKDAFGGLSNMAGGFPLEVNGSRILTTEALYQACRFPHLGEVQRLIISQSSPMTAKMRSKPFRSQTRDDWLRVRVRIMRWCLACKLIQNREVFSKLLMETKNLPIVEQSSKDKFWGAVPSGPNELVGANVLGRLLMELREKVINSQISLSELEPPEVPNFLLYGAPIEIVTDAILRENSLF
ncbi:NADAR family protein [Pseudomonas sp. ANT_J28]|uniref:NADAR family protein n=1 Tax=Pseudomonas sp. ANT_J28 TaxID=2597352 RepID=UPI0011F337DC|nr:NADAR family protein [Pseudomonas sp. ANT_J28]KAA0985447.1 NADAR family protein [Pseudomonas sp. ANT_J28]